MIRIPYGKDRLFRKPLCSTADYGSHLTAAPAELVAGDVKVKHDRLIPTTAAFKQVAFTSGGVLEIRPGDVITGATSGATATVIGSVLTSGTWAGGDAAGTLVVRSDAGTFQAENLNTPTQANIATIGGALAASGVPAFANEEILFGVPGSQFLGQRGIVLIKDQTGTELWCDDGYEFETVDHPLAADPQGCLYAGVATAIGASSFTGENGESGIAYPLAGDVDTAPGLVAVVEDSTLGQGQVVPILSFVHATRVFTLRYAWPLTPTGTLSYKIYAISDLPVDLKRILGVARAAGQTPPTARIG